MRRGGTCEPGGFCHGDPQVPARCVGCQRWPWAAYQEPTRPEADTSRLVWQRHFANAKEQRGLTE